MVRCSVLKIKQLKSKKNMDNAVSLRESGEKRHSVYFAASTHRTAAKQRVQNRIRTHLT